MKLTYVFLFTVNLFTPLCCAMEPPVAPMDSDNNSESLTVGQARALYTLRAIFNERDRERQVWLPVRIQSPFQTASPELVRYFHDNTHQNNVSSSPVTLTQAPTEYFLRSEEEATNNEKN